MKILLLFPDIYSLNKTFSSGFEQLGHEVKSICFRDYFPHWRNRLNDRTAYLPIRFTKYLYKAYLKNINLSYIKTIEIEKPDLVIVYNDQLLLPETARIIKKKCPIFNFLGDNPLSLVKNPFNIPPLMEMDHVFSHDTFWIKQLKQIGISKISHLILGYNPTLNYRLKPSKIELEKYSSDLLMIGSAHTNSFGFKRALFYSKFLDLDIKIYGEVWENWYDYFPKLKNKHVSLKKRLSFEMVNLISNCCKIYPIDANPGLVFGLHIRIFDCLGSGLLPLIEYRKDLDIVFNNLNVPTIKCYDEAKEKAVYYLKNEKERKDIINNLREYIGNNFTPKIAAEKIINIYLSLHK